MAGGTEEKLYFFSKDFRIESAKSGNYCLDEGMLSYSSVMIGENLPNPSLVRVYSYGLLLDLPKTGV